MVKNKAQGNTEHWLELLWPFCPSPRDLSLYLSVFRCWVALTRQFSTAAVCSISWVCLNPICNPINVLVLMLLVLSDHENRCACMLQCENLSFLSTSENFAEDDKCVSTLKKQMSCKLSLELGFGWILEVLRDFRNVIWSKNLHQSSYWIKHKQNGLKCMSKSLPYTDGTDAKPDMKSNMYLENRTFYSQINSFTVKMCVLPSGGQVCQAASWGKSILWCVCSKGVTLFQVACMPGCLQRSDSCGMSEFLYEGCVCRW